MDNEIIEWRKAVTLIMLQNGKEPYDIQEAIKELEPLVFGCNQKDEE